VLDDKDGREPVEEAAKVTGGQELTRGAISDISTKTIEGLYI